MKTLLLLLLCGALTATAQDYTTTLDISGALTAKCDGRLVVPIGATRSAVRADALKHGYTESDSPNPETLCFTANKGEVLLLVVFSSDEAQSSSRATILQIELGSRRQARENYQQIRNILEETYPAVDEIEGVGRIYYRQCPDGRNVMQVDQDGTKLKMTMHLLDEVGDE